ncbi:MAG TPA: hypothetical protein VGW38_13795, partial [Chloroflexota bacterium]|nr:hypothetical protein [Chloroflexota bacterium]
MSNAALPVLLGRLEAYYDSVPWTAARAGVWSPFVLFVNEGPVWPYYARPLLGGTAFTAQPAGSDSVAR